MEVETTSLSGLVRPDGRGPSACRRTFLRSGVVGGGATGSCYGEFSRTRVLVSVFGPRPKERDSLKSSVANQNPLEMELQCNVHLAGGQGDGEMQATARRMAQKVKQCILPSIQQDKLPKTCLELQCTILESDGCDIGPVVMCASVALASSNIPLFDLVTYCSLVSVGILQPAVQSPTLSVRVKQLCFANLV
jgi:exosome complex component MTR3